VLSHGERMIPSDPRLRRLAVVGLVLADLLGSAKTAAPQQTFTFTDAPLAAQVTSAKVAHITELHQASRPLGRSAGSHRLPTLTPVDSPRDTRPRRPRNRLAGSVE